MDATEITRRLEISRLAVDYYESQQRGDPFEVQFHIYRDAPWRDDPTPTFWCEWHWRRKPREPRRVTLYRYGERWLDCRGSQKPDEAVEFIEVLPEPKKEQATTAASFCCADEAKLEPSPVDANRRRWVAKRNLWCKKCDAQWNADDNDDIVEVEVLE
jgi:hypothetical protein